MAHDAFGSLHRGTKHWVFWIAIAGSACPRFVCTQSLVKRSGWRCSNATPAWIRNGIWNAGATAVGSWPNAATSAVVPTLMAKGHPAPPAEGGARMDRLARNAEDLLRIVRELTGRGVSVEFVKNHLTFSGRADPMGKLMLTMLAAFGEFERELIRGRQREGIAIAKAKGVYKGRKKALATEQLQELVELARSGMPKAELARSYGIGRETVYQYLRSGA